MPSLKTWYKPGGTVQNLCLDMLQQPHLLIAGATGSGKSVLINSLLYNALYQSPNSCHLILIDPKRVELVDYKRLPHVIRYASEPPQIVDAIARAVEIMEARYRKMQKQRVKLSDAADLYVVIDEFADLMTTQKKQTLPPLQRIAQLGRAAKVHLVVATQRPTSDIINGQIKVNIDARVALRCPTGQDSRNIIRVKGAEMLPRYGYGYYLTPSTMQPELVDIPLTAPADLIDRVQWWQKQNKGLFTWLYRPF